MRYIDSHFHADPRGKDGGDLPKVAKWMEDHGVERVVLLELEKWMPQNEAEAQQIKDNFAAYANRMYRFSVIPPEFINTKEEAVAALAKLKADGAIGFGEHYGRNRNFDDPTCMRLYAACAEVELPVLFHIDGKNNINDENLSHLENALKRHPDCIFIGHGPGFWKRMKAADVLMSKHKNLYADISAGSGARAIGRDSDYSRDFITRHADRVLFGTDGGPWSFDKEKPPHFELVESLNLTPEIKAKLCYQNAETLFGFTE